MNSSITYCGKTRFKMLTYLTGIYARRDDTIRMRQSSFFPKKISFVAQTIRAHTHPEFEYHQCLHVYKYVDQNGSVLTTRGQQGVAPEVNLRNPLHVGD